MSIYKLAFFAVLLVTITLAYPTYEEFCEMFPGHCPEKQSEEYQKRKLIYEQRVASWADIQDYQPGVSQWTDIPEENLPRGLSEDLPTNTESEKVGVNRRVGAPTSFNWKEREAVTSIKNQGQCGSCWAFASAACAESHLILKGEYDFDEIDLSQQYIFKCTKMSNCGGGYLNYAMAVARRVPTEQEYPYQPEKQDDEICYAEGIEVAITHHPYSDLTDEELITLLDEGPLAIILSSEKWVGYSSGVFSCEKNAKIDHAVLLVGYDENSWLIKNQWGTTWGQEGYIRINRDRTDNKNCLIGHSAYSLLEKNITFLIGLFLVLLALVL